MRQVTQRLRDGRIEIVTAPIPNLRPEGVLVAVRASLLSAGTERSKVTNGRQSLIRKAQSRPDQVQEVLEKARRDGWGETIAAVRNRLDQPRALGYSSSGVVVAVGGRVQEVRPGDRVACAGAHYAFHADVNYVPANLCARVPEGVTFAEAAFTTVGSIALHGVRQAAVQLGEHVAVIGLGLVGQLTAQILHAAGCSVTGIDLDPATVERAKSLGAVDHGFERSALNDARVSHCDAVIITAAAESADPVELAGELARDRGRVVIVGDIGLSFRREPYYHKELEIRMSRSYGPGRYDSNYEERGIDYPIGYVRWTEKRNMCAFLDLIATGKVDVSGLVAERFPLEEAPIAYDRLVTSSSSPLGLLLEYDAAAPRIGEVPQADVTTAARSVVGSPRKAAIIGAGSFARRVLIPSLRAAGFEITTIASAGGLSATVAGRNSSVRPDTVDAALEDPDAGLVAVATRHASHAELAARALSAGKHVFVEKPPAITFTELRLLRELRDRTGRILAVGFNRRYSPLARKMREHVRIPGEPLEIVYRVNAGPLSTKHWLNDLDEGGGRLIGEGCHFVDFVCWLVGELPRAVSCEMTADMSQPLLSAQRFILNVAFPDGSLGMILYGVGGTTRLGKEYVEAHSGGRSAAIHDFRRLTLTTRSHSRSSRLRSADKGHRRQAEDLHASLAAGGAVVIEPDPLSTMAVTLTAGTSAQMGARVPIDPTSGEPIGLAAETPASTDDDG